MSATPSEVELGLESRVLLLPPTQRDAEVMGRVMSGAAISCHVCDDMSALCDEIKHGVAAVLVSEEALLASPDVLIECLRAQPVWSDLSTVVLSRSGAEAPRLSAILPHLGNVTVVERPVRITTLVSLVRLCLRGRDRQYQVRSQIAEVERSEERRASLLEAERAARNEAERAGQMKDEFLATLSHELRTPLNAILGWSQVLSMRPPTGEELAEGLRTIERNARAQTQIIEDLLDMSRIISGKVSMHMQRVALAPVVQAAIDTVKPMLDTKGVQLEVSLDRVTGFVRGDVNRLQQVFWNLLSNAVKFTPKGGHVGVAMKRVDAHFEVSVTDSGQGINPEFLPRVFDRFRQADASITRRHGGLGLGLAIVKQIVDMHCGRVRALSDGAGTGATFCVALPVVAADAVTEMRSEKPLRGDRLCVPSPRGHLQHIPGVRVLVVDDEPDSRELVKRLLEEAQATVTAAGSAREAFELLQELRPDILVSDIGMPGEDGYSLIRRVRALGSDQGGETPAVAVTAYARAEDRVTAIQAGFQHHLSKPIEPAELVAIVASLAPRR